MVEVFKTNVASSTQAASIQGKLQEHFPECRATFDLEDCDRVLRIEAGNVNVSVVIFIVKSMNHSCEVLND